MPFKDVEKRRAWQRQYFKKRYHTEWKYDEEYVRKNRENSKNYQKDLRKNHPEKKKLSNDRYTAKHKKDRQLKYYAKKVKELKDEIKLLKFKLRFEIGLSCKR